MRMIQPITLIGSQAPGGLYILRINVSGGVFVRFGRYQKGERALVPAGEYVYVGSARGKLGASTLANRLLRHASRSGDNPSHSIRPFLAEKLNSSQVNKNFSQKKTLHWHVDFLLDLQEAEISHVIALFDAKYNESSLMKIIQDSFGTEPLIPGLGASDDPGNTHLLPFQGGDVWWIKLVVVLQGEAV